MPTSRPLIVAVNNDAAFLHLLETLLHDEGFDTLLLQTGDIAVDTIRQHRPELIILDICSRKMTGLRNWARICSPSHLI